MGVYLVVLLIFLSISKVNNMEEKEVYQQTILKFGEINQLIMLFEELSELTKAVTKYIRAKDTTQIHIHKCKSHIVEEIVDVEIMISQLKEIINVDDKHYQSQKEHKLNRLKKIIQ